MIADSKRSDNSRARREIADDTLIFPSFAPTSERSAPTLVLRNTPEGDLVAIAFTELDRLVKSFGPKQDWVAFSRGDLEEIFEGAKVARVIIDPDVILGEGAEQSESNSMMRHVSIPKDPET